MKPQDDTMRPMIQIAAQRFALDRDETLLEGLLRAEMPIESGCRSGQCQSCRVRVVSGDVQPAWSQGLPADQIERGWILSCLAKPKGDLHLAATEAAPRFASEIVQIAPLSETVTGLRLRRPAGYVAAGGQHLGLLPPLCDTPRRYSIASASDAATLELHVRHVEGGVISDWLRSQAALGCPVEVTDARGDCRYSPEAHDRPLLLVGVGTGLAPMVGILREALLAEHSAKIMLWAAGRSPERLYFLDELRRIASQSDAVSVHFAVTEGAMGKPEFREGDLLSLIKAEAIPLKGYRVYLAGDPDFAKRLQRGLFLAGAELKDIKVDLFEPSAR